jgi:ABC-type antimicrobial peptide transport system permease subunit
VQGHILATTARPLLIGAVVGLGLALAGSRVLESLLFQVSARDPWTLGAATLLVIGMGLAAAWWPAMRASQVDPVEALAAA